MPVVDLYIVRGSLISLRHQLVEEIPFIDVVGEVRHHLLDVTPLRQSLRDRLLFLGDAVQVQQGGGIAQRLVRGMLFV